MTIWRVYQDLLMRNELDLIQALDLPQFVVRDLISNVCRAVSPSCASVCPPTGPVPFTPHV
jgi:hypothetical protein